MQLSLNRGKVHRIQKGLGKPVSKANSKKQSIGTPDPQPCSKSNWACIDGTGNKKEEEAEMPDPQSCSSSNQASMDGNSDEKEEETRAFDGPLFSQLQDVLLSRLRDGTPAYPRSC